ncbi:hypothetical protein WME90_32470 [Sorangium sp. So ce375]|uniref:hypothetical protein n=1 Tax=Sorangium sp. So ce375 TaxID=3133306 RepID=UPI003F5BE892
MDVQDIAKRICEFDERFAHLEDDREDFEEDLADVDGMDRSTYLDFLARRGATPFGRLLSEFRNFVIPGVLDAYAQGSDHERRAIREIFAQRRRATLELWSLLDERAWLLSKSPAQEKPGLLRTLLLLGVLAERYLDDYQTAMILTSAWRNVENDGLDPKRFFDDVAKMAGQDKLEHGRSASELLRDFEPYIYDQSAPVKRV